MRYLSDLDWDDDYDTGAVLAYRVALSREGVEPSEHERSWQALPRAERQAWISGVTS